MPVATGGSGLVAGRITNEFRWQASGYFSINCPQDVDGLDITTCYHLMLNATGDLQDVGTTSSASKREWDPEEDAATYDDHLESYFEAFPHQIPDTYHNLVDGIHLHKRQIANCGNVVTTTVIPTTYTTVTTVTSESTSILPTSSPTPVPKRVKRSFLGKILDANTVISDDGSGNTDSLDQPTATVATSTFVTTTTILSTTTITSVIPATTTPTSPRQRTEMLSWPGAAANETWYYSWKSYQDAATGSGNSFFHTWQLLRRDYCGGPVITFDLVQGQAQINDYVAARACSINKGDCPSVPASQLLGKTLRHTVIVRYGLQGTFEYSVRDVANADTALLTYSAEGDMGASGSIKFGNYRAVVKGNTAAQAYLGDYLATQLS